MTLFNLSKQDIKKGLVLALVVFLSLFHIGIFFIDVRWWWSLFLGVPLAITVLVMYKTDIDENHQLRTKISFVLGWIVFYMFLFVLISAIFITRLWWFGIILVLVLFFSYASLQNEYLPHTLPEKEKKRLSIIMLTWFAVLFLFYCIPSFVANSNKNPQDRFNSTAIAVQSYTLYASTGSANKEHVIPISHCKNNSNDSITRNYYNDYVNVILANEMANNLRGNLPFGNVKKNVSTQILHHGVIVGYRDGKHFMPTDQYKGDVARIVLYMYVTYKDDCLSKNDVNVSLMKKWAKIDPVSPQEIARNIRIKQEFGYGNRFVSQPRLIRFVV